MPTTIRCGDAAAWQVGNYFGKGGAVTGVHATVSRDYDRAAPRGTGDVKAGGNYAADLLPLKIAKEEGFGTTLYLDAAEQKCGRAFVTAASPCTRDGEGDSCVGRIVAGISRSFLSPIS